MSINYNPSIVTNGLVLALDAGNTKAFDNAENLLLQSEDFANASWTKQNAFSITSNTAIAPDGTLTADTASRVNLAAEYLFQAYGGTPGTFTLSCWVRTVTGTATFQMFTYNGTDGTLGVVTHTATTTWQRFSTTATVTTTSNWYPCIPTTSNTQFYIWGAQLERGTTVSNYYKTTVSIKNRGTIWTDLSGNGRNGTLTNGPTYNSNNGGSIAFDGTNDYAEFGDVLDMGTNSMTINAWISLNSTFSSLGYIVSKALLATQNYRFGVYVTSAKKLGTFVQGNSPGADIVPETNEVLLTDRFYMVTSVINRSSNISMYINANVQTLTGSSTISQWNSLNFQSTNPFRVGSYTAADNVSPLVFFNGNIAQVSIYNRALTELEIQQNFNATRSRYGI